MDLHALNNPERKVPRVEGIVENSEVGTRPVYCEDFKHDDRKCTRTRLLNRHECFVFDSEMEIPTGARVKFYEHDRSETGSIVYLAGIEVLSSNPVLRKAMSIYEFRD